MLRIEIQIIHIADSAMVLTGCCDHKWVDATKEATCTEEGMEVGKCSVCKAEIEKKIDKTGNTEGDWEITEEAKWNGPGTRVKK